MLIAEADDTTRDGFGQLVLDQLTAARSVSYDACIRLLRSELNISAVLPPEIAERERQLLTQVLAAPRSNAAPRRNRQTVEAALRALATRLTSQDFDVVSAPERYQDEPRLLCDSHIELYAAAMSMPIKLRSAALEGLFLSNGR